MSRRDRRIVLSMRRQYESFCSSVCCLACVLQARPTKTQRDGEMECLAVIVVPKQTCANEV